MLFNSWQYAVFLPAVFILYWALPQRFRIYILFISSFWFYMSWNVRYVTLILFTTIVSYFAALFLERTQSTRTKKLILIVSLIACLGVLFVFKYFNFFMETLSELASLFALRMHPMTLKLMLPVGISFYTFQTLSYVIDVYRGQTSAEHDFITYATFVSFFPQLVAGPIERSNNLLPQIKAHHEFDYSQGSYGLKLIAWGLFKKVAIADTLAVWVDRVYANVTNYHGFVLVVATVFFTLQIYCDFSGYSDVARGSAKLFGIELMDNFKSPYFASSIREFWSRWHISLSTWFRDYVYIPLGGNRRGKFRRYMNIMITFLVSGLWHGASWTFVVWGGVHGLAQVLEDAFGLNRRRNIISMAGVFAFTCCAWVFFRAQTFGDAAYIFAHSLDGIKGITAYVRECITSLKAIQGNLKNIALKVIILALCDYASFNESFILKLGRQRAIVRWALYICFTFYMIAGAMPNVKRSAEFIYFQF